VEKRSPGRNTCQGAYGRSTSYSSHSSHRWSRTPMTACCQLAWVRPPAACVGNRCEAEVRLARTRVSNGSRGAVRRLDRLGRKADVEVARPTPDVRLLRQPAVGDIRPPVL